MMDIKAALVAIVIVVVIAYGVYAVLSGGGYTNVSSPTKLSLAVSGKPILFKITGQEYGMYLASDSNFTKTATVYVHEIPVFTSNAYAVSVTLNNTTHVNVGTKFANMGIQLNGITPSGVTVTIFPIQQYANTQPDNSSISIVPESLLLGQTGGANQTAPTTTAATTTVSATTTISGSQTTVSSTTTAASTTTTIAGPNETLVSIRVAENKTYYSLLENFSNLYAQEPDCTPLLYNNTYFASRGYQPTGLSDYYNATLNTPNKLTSNITSLGGTIYAVTFYGYIAGVPQLNGRPAATIVINTTGAQLSSIRLSGIYAGENQTSLLNAYRRALTFSSGSNQACDAMLGSVP